MRSINVQPAIDLIKKFEGCKLEAYQDMVGVATIGYGTTVYPNGNRVKLWEKCSQEEAETFLHAEIDRILVAISETVTAPLTENQICALISFTYNLGVGCLKRSTMVKLINGGASKEAIAAQFARWVKAGGVEVEGLVKRRAAEAELFIS